MDGLYLQTILSARNMIDGRVTKTTFTDKTGFRG